MKDTIKRLRELEAAALEGDPKLQGETAESGEFIDLLVDSASQLLDRLEKLEDVAAHTQKMVTTLEKLMTLCEVDFIVTVDGQDYRMDVTKEVKDALAALEKP